MTDAEKNRLRAAAGRAAKDECDMEAFGTIHFGLVHASAKESFDRIEELFEKHCISTWDNEIIGGCHVMSGEWFKTDEIDGILLHEGLILDGWQVDDIVELNELMQVPGIAAILE